MIRFIVRAFVALVSSAVGLIVAAAVLDGVHLNASAFITAVVIFTVVSALLQPFLVFQLRRSAALGGVALVATLASLIVTDVLSSGLSINGIGAWIAATGIVWLASLLATFILPFLGLKKYLEKRSD